jgi:hypothetical protein
MAIGRPPANHGRIGFPPQQYAGSEADGFYSFLPAKDLRVPWFQRVFEFERAAMQTLCDGESRVVHFPADPLPVLRGRRPVIATAYGSGVSTLPQILLCFGPPLVTIQNMDHANLLQFGG